VIALPNCAVVGGSRRRLTAPRPALPAPGSSLGGPPGASSEQGLDDLIYLGYERIYFRSLRITITLVTTQVSDIRQILDLPPLRAVIHSSIFKSIVQILEHRFLPERDTVICDQFFKVPFKHGTSHHTG
jgi:hypothetical protein